MSSRAVRGAVLLVVLAGCGAVPFGAESQATPRETLSPVPVERTPGTPTPGTPTPGTPTPGPTPPSVRWPPGLSPDGSVNVTGLGAEHAGYLTGRSSTQVLRYDVNGTRASLQWSLTRRIRVDGERVLVEDSNVSGFGDRTLYLTDSSGYERVVADDETAARPTARWIHLRTARNWSNSSPRAST